MEPLLKLKEIVEKFGFKIIDEDENSVLFRYQLNYIQAIMAETEDFYTLSLNLGRLFTAENADELKRSLRACNHLNDKIMQVKFYLDQDDELTIASESIIPKECDADLIFGMGLRLLVLGKMRFIELYGEYVEEDRLLAELEDTALTDDADAVENDEDEMSLEDPSAQTESSDED